MTATAILFLSCLTASAALPASECQRIADAVWRVEGGSHTRYPYGVVSIKTHSAAHARRICLVSIRNNWQRWEAAGRPGRFLDFMADRWCPAVDSPQGNANWKRNMRLIVGAIAEATPKDYSGNSNRVETPPSTTAPKKSGQGSPAGPARSPRR